MFETGFLWSDAVGLAGVACVIGAYALLQLEAVTGDSLRYLGLNLAGADRAIGRGRLGSV